MANRKAHPLVVTKDMFSQIHFCYIPRFLLPPLHSLFVPAVQGDSCILGKVPTTEPCH